MDNKPQSENREMEYTRDWAKEDCEPGTKFAKIPLKKLNLKLNQKFSYVYDFGDDHQFEVQVVSFGEEDLGEEYPRILESKGEAPEQYPDYD